MRAATTSRLKSSLSTSPRNMRPNASSNTWCSASTSTSVSVPAATMPKSCIQTGLLPCGATRCGCSSSTFRPMCSSIGRLSDNVTCAPRCKILNRSVLAPASSGLYSDMPSGCASESVAIISMSGTAERAEISSR